MKQLNKDKEKLEKNEGKINKLQEETKNNKVKVEAVKISDEGSLVTKEFTFVNGKLS